MTTQFTYLFRWHSSTCFVGAIVKRATMQPLSAEQRQAQYNAIATALTPMCI
jgi:hypothetical protein